MRSEKIFLIKGKASDKKQNGIFGLSIVAYDKDLLFDDRLGISITNEKGRFHLNYSEDDFCDLFESAPDIYIDIFDCDGQKIYSTIKAIKWNAKRATTLDITIPDGKLSNHLNHSRPLERLSGGIVASEKLDLIDRAAALLENRIADGTVPPIGGIGRPPKNPGHQVPLSAAYCPAPDILGFGDLVDTAWGVLVDDPRAIAQFEDVISTLFYRVRVRRPEVAESVSRNWAEDRPQDFQALTKILETKRRAATQTPGETLMEADRLIPVLAAALILADGDPILENRYLGILLGQFDALDQLDVVYRAARGALASNPHGLGGFGDFLGHIGGTCGPDDGPLPWPHETDDWIDVDDIWRLERWHCAADLTRAARSGALSGGRYEIIAADWADGCPGSAAVLTGTDFSGLFPDRNRVVFPHQNGWDTIRVAPASPADWTDTRIEVTIPDVAGPGMASLEITGNYAAVCGHAILTPRRGNSMAFIGGGAHIRVFTANDRTGTFEIAPGETATLRWVAVPPSADVHLRVVQNGTEIPVGDITAEGECDIAIPAGARSHTVCTLTADNDCPGSETRTISFHGGLTPELDIPGIEVTQAIQYHRAWEHLTDPADQGRDNSVRLVVGKPAMVRVYLRSGLPLTFDGGSVSGVTGTLDVERIEGGAATLLTTISSLPVTVEADQIYAVERGDLSRTLNFLVPAIYLSGRLQFTVRVNTPMPTDWFGRTTEASLTFDVDLEQTLQVAGIMVGYNDPPNPPIAAPGLGDLIATARSMIAAYPVRADSATTFRIAGTITQTVPLTDAIPASGACPPNWSALMADLRDAAALDAGAALGGGNWVYYGLLAVGIPVDTPGGATGCGGDGVGCGVVGAEWTMAHEVGHALGLAHAPCGGAANVDPAYPAYEPYDPAGTPTASIGEYGFAFISGASNLHHPATADLMSYCGPEWISLYQYDRLLDLELLSATTLPIAPSASTASAKNASAKGSGAKGSSAEGSSVTRSIGWGSGALSPPVRKRTHERRRMAPEPFIGLTLFLDSDDAIEIHSVMRLTTTSQVVGGIATDIVAELLDKDGMVIAGAGALELPLEGPSLNTAEKGCSCRKLLRALVSDRARGAKLHIRRGDRIFWQREAPATQVSVKDVKAKVNANHVLKLNWSPTLDSGLDPRTEVMWSPEGTGAWRVLTIGLSGNKADLDLSAVPGGKVVFKVLVSDGFDTTSAISNAVEIAHKPPTAAILSPIDDAVLTTGAPMRLWAAAVDETGKAIDETACRWTLNGQEIATGTDAIVAAPEAGEHELVFETSDEHGTATAHRSFTTSG